MKFLESTAKGRETRTKTTLIHVGAIVRAAIVLVGIPNKLRFEGNGPYIHAPRFTMNTGLEPCICWVTMKACILSIRLQPRLRQWVSSVHLR